MSDPFQFIGEPETPRFEEAVQDAVRKLEAAAARFDAVFAQVPEDAFTEDEWRIVESAATEVAEAVERAEEGYVAVQFDSHAWYRVMENLEKVYLRLESALGVMEQVRDRSAQ